MLKAQLITIGTEITCGEVVNTNAAWVSQRLEEMGVRVYSHLSVTDQRDAILQALAVDHGCKIVIVTGGLGPTSDDITRDCVAEHAGCVLEFDDGVYSSLVTSYQQRGLTLREAHKQQCHFPKGSERLSNPVGTALGFCLQHKGRQFFVLPGPPRELEAMWNLEVEPRLKRSVPAGNSEWVRWTVLGLPESEVAELVEPALGGSGIEVGYRAAVPYVKVKVYVDRSNAKHEQVINAIEKALHEHIIARGNEDVATELLRQWPRPELTLWDFVTDNQLTARLFGAQRELLQRKEKFPTLNSHAIQSTEALPQAMPDIEVRSHGEEFIVTMTVSGRVVNERMKLPFKIPLSSERGKRSVAEWAIWFCLKALRAH